MDVAERLDETLYIVQKCHTNGSASAEIFSDTIATSSWQNSCLPASREVGNSLCLQPNVHSVSKGTGLLKNALSTPNHVPAMYNLAGTRLYVDPDLPSEVQDKVTSCYMLMTTACTFSYVKFCYYTYVSFLYFLLLFLGMVRQVLCLQSSGCPAGAGSCWVMWCHMCGDLVKEEQCHPCCMWIKSSAQVHWPQPPSCFCEYSFVSLTHVLWMPALCVLGSQLMPHLLIPSPFHSWVFTLILKTWEKCQMQIFV